MSPFLRKIQFKNLCDKIDTEPELYKSYKSKFSDSIEIIWVKEITEIPKKESIHFFLANEFFDALPIQKFQVYCFLCFFLKCFIKFILLELTQLNFLILEDFIFIRKHLKVIEKF